VLAVCFVGYHRVHTGRLVGESLIHDLRNHIFEHLQRMDMGFFHRTRIGRIISRMTSDSEYVRAGLQDAVFISAVNAGQMLVAAAILVWTSWRLALVVLCFTPIYYLYYYHFRRKLSEAHRAGAESMSRVTANLAESVVGVRVTQGYARQDLNAHLFGELVEDHAQNNLAIARAAGTFSPMLEWLNQIVIATIVIFGGILVLHFNEPVDILITFYLMASLMLDPVASLGQQYNTAVQAMAGAERVFRMVDQQPSFTDPPDAIRLPPISGRVEFRKLTFGYDPAKPVLHEINFVAEPGMTVALVGHTGSGKSSIINLISKFYQPTSGEVLIDGIDIRRVDSESLHRQMGIVLQNNFLFTGTVIENIRVGKPGASDAEVLEAVKAIDALDLLEALPEGLSSQVGERGGNISLGQRQLVCFARAMLADPRIIILDEATSAVDTMTEVRIQRALSILLKGRTSFVVAHRLSTIRHADIVLVLDRGRIVERGTHTQLLTTGGVYANLYRQFIRASEV
jgi:ATP-binding cassette subfamily B protein